MRDGFHYIVINNGKIGLVFYTDKLQDKISIPSYAVSKIGMEIFSLVDSVTPQIYIQKIAALMKSKGFSEAKIGVWIPDISGDPEKYTVQNLADLPGFNDI